MKKFKIPIWEKHEYSYPMAFGFVPNIMAYLHEENEETRPCMVVVPGGGYCIVSPTEGGIVAEKFFNMGYQVFVLTYTTNILMAAPLKNQPMKDISRAVRMIRSHAENWHINPEKLVVCGFSAGAHLCGSVCVHYKDVQETSEAYCGFSNRPDAAILSYPVVTSGEYAHRDSFKALLGLDIYENDDKNELAYMSLEKHVTPDTPPCFLWQTVEDELVSVENSALFAAACKKQKVPFAYHVFSKGKHGLSLADENWGYGRFREAYELEQTLAVIEAVKNDIFPMPEEAKTFFLQSFSHLSDPNAALRIDEINPEVRIWPELADTWLNTLYI